MSKVRYEIIAQVFDKRGRLLAQATNSYTKTHPLQAYFAEKVGHPQKEFLHAEIAALLKCKDKQPHTLKVFRYGTGGFYRCAKPCVICQEAIFAFNLTEVWYSEINNELVRLPLPTR